MTEHDPTDIAEQERAASQRAAEYANNRATEGDDLKWLMGSKRGRRIVWRLLSQAGVFRLSFSTNAMQMAFNEGQRNFGNSTLALIHSQCPELYPVMVKENSRD